MTARPIVSGDVAQGFRALDQPTFDWAISNALLRLTRRAAGAGPGKMGAWMADDGLKAWTGFLR